MAKTVLLNCGLKYSIGLYFFFILPVFSDQEILLLNDQIKILSQHQQWLALLHITPKRFFGSWSSGIDDPKFFLSSSRTPEDELRATIREFSQGDPTDKKHPINKFPCRLYWILTKLPQLRQKFVSTESTYFKKIFKYIKPYQTRLIFPSQYMNNPSSLFGHTLLNIECENNDKLMAYSVNYAAKTKETNGLIFSFKGLFGLYKGYYSIGPYFEKVVEYSDVDRRDIWEYALNFTVEELKMLMMHIWELEDISSDYYFFDENCSYNLLFLLDVMRPELKLAEKADRFWVLPVDTVKLIYKQGLVVNHNHRPSKAFKIHELSKPLKKEQKQMVKYAASSEQAHENFEEWHHFDTEIQRAMLDTVLELLYVNLDKGVINISVYRQSYYAALKKRAKLGKKESIHNKGSVYNPAEGHNSFLIGGGSGYYLDQHYISMRIRPTYHGLDDPPRGYLLGGAIEALDTEVYYFSKKRRYSLRRFDLVKIHSFAPGDDFYSSTSWQISTGLVGLPIKTDEELCSAGYIRGGAGVTYNVAEDVLFRCMFLSEIVCSHHLHLHHGLFLGGEIGLLAHFVGKYSLQVQGGYSRSVSGYNGNLLQASAQLNYHLHTNMSIGFFSRFKKEFFSRGWESGVFVNMFF